MMRTHPRCGRIRIIVKLDGVGRLHQQVYRALLGEILGGRLTSGERVPSTRQVATLLKVSRNTALLAYEQLLAEGFITPRSGAAGTVVAPVLPPDGYVARPTRRPGSTRPETPRRSTGAFGCRRTICEVGQGVRQYPRIALAHVGTGATDYPLRFPSRTRLLRRPALCPLAPAIECTSPGRQSRRPRIRPTGGTPRTA